MITHYDIKMEMQKLKEVLSVEGVNIPSLLQVIKPGTYVFLWVLLWPTFLRLVSVKSDVRDVGFDICASGMMGFLLGFAPIFPDTCYHLTHYWLAAVDIPVASDNPVHYADAIRYNARTPLQGSLLPLTRLVWA